MARKGVIGQFASLSEEALGKLAQNPAANKAIQSAMQMKDRVDDLSKRVRGLEQMEKRLAQLEKRIAKLEGPSAKPPAARKQAAKKPSTETAKPDK